MARIVKTKDAAHNKRMRCDKNDGEMLLVGRGRNAYLWVGSDAGRAAPIRRVALRKFVMGDPGRHQVTPNA